MSVTIIAELCGQWGGDIKRAERMMLQCKMAGADFAKVQIWDTFKLPGENRVKWKYLEMCPNKFTRLSNYGDQIKLPVFASCFDEDSFLYTKSYTPIYKIASGLLEWDFELAKKISESKGTVFCSLGKWDKDEYPFDNPNVIYMHCVSKYPHTTEEAIAAMPKQFSGHMLGYSCHALGIEACKEAIRRGAKYIEKHYTTDKTLQSETEGAHVCSMEMDELEELRKYADMQSNCNQ